MGKKSHPFVPKASSRTYKVVYRPQQDVVSAPGDGDTGVLRLTRSGVDVKSEDAVSYRPENAFEDTAYRRADYEHGDLGLPDDGYNYGQHLRSMGTQTGLGTSVMYLQRKDAAPETEDLSPAQHSEALEKQRRVDEDLDEVLRALEDDDDDDHDNDDDDDDEQDSDVQNFTGEQPCGDRGTMPHHVLLEDNFLSLAAGDGATCQNRRPVPEVGQTTATEDVREVRLLDEQFEQLLREEYDDHETSDEDEGPVQAEDDVAWKDFLRQEAPRKVVRTREDPLEVTTDKRFLVSVEDENSRDLEQFDASDTDEDDWDCQSVLTTYTNLENHPTVIGAPPPRQRKIKLDPKLQAPLDYLPKRPVQEDLREIPTVAVAMPTPRQRGESKEEKQTRKRMVKEQRQLRRAEKSTMRQAFRSENVRQSVAQVAMGEMKVSIQFSS